MLWCRCWAFRVYTMTGEKGRGSEVNRKSFYCFGKKAITTSFTRSAFQQVVFPANKSSNVAFTTTKDKQNTYKTKKSRTEAKRITSLLQFWTAGGPSTAVWRIQQLRASAWRFAQDEYSATRRLKPAVRLSSGNMLQVLQ